MSGLPDGHHHLASCSTNVSFPCELLAQHCQAMSMHAMGEAQNMTAPRSSFNVMLASACHTPQVPRKPRTCTSSANSLLGNLPTLV